MDLDVQEEARRVGTRLRELLEHPATDQASLQRWTDDAMRFSECWSPSLCDRLPHGLWHWLSDAPDRLENREYARIQNEWMAGVVAWLEAGAENRWEGGEHPPWPRIGRRILALIALAGLAALLLWSHCRNQNEDSQELRQVMGFSFTDDAGVTCTGFPTIDAEGCRIFWIKSDDGLGDFGAKLRCGEVKTFCGRPYLCNCEDARVVGKKGGENAQRSCVARPLDTGDGCVVHVIDGAHPVDAGRHRELRMAYGDHLVLCGHSVFCKSAAPRRQ